MLLLIDDKGKPEKVSRIVEISKNYGSNIQSCRVILKDTSRWWLVSKISFFEVGSPQSILSKFKAEKKLSDNNVLFPRKKLERLAKNKNINYNEQH